MYDYYIINNNNNYNPLIINNNKKNGLTKKSFIFNISIMKQKT